MIHLTGLHLLLTYRCPYDCDHCFVYSSPEARGTFTLAQVEDVLRQGKEVGTVEEIYFEGGEPFLLYPVMVAAMGSAKGMGFRVGAVTNCYWATSVEDARIWLEPLARIGLFDLALSDDPLHFEEADADLPRNARAAAEQIGIPVSGICLAEPHRRRAAEPLHGRPITGGNVLFRGRAADLLTPGMLRRSWEELNACGQEDLATPSRVHVDPYGFVHLCQGVTMGNLFEVPLRTLVDRYVPEAHPIAGPLLAGGPAALAERYGIPHEAGYVDTCHFCFEVRRALRARFPGYLAPGQVYGEEGEPGEAARLWERTTRWVKA